MHRLLALSLLVPACVQFDDNPPPPTNNGEETGTLPLEFSGVQPVNNNFPNQLDLNNHIAVGGTHDVTLKLDTDFTELAQPFDADTLTPSLLAIDEVSGPHVRLRAVAGGLDALVISDPSTGELYDDALYAMSEFSRAVAIGEEYLTSSDGSISTQPYVFAAGSRRVGVAYLNGATPPNRLVDTSATLSVAGATQTRWDEVTFEAATAGIHTIDVTIGGVQTSIEVEVVEDADEVKSLFTVSGIACFGAFAHDTFISGAGWTYTIDGVPFVSDPALTAVFGSNCVFFDGADEHTVKATSFGTTITVTSPASMP
jgi:hypothetical protein